MFRAKGYRSAHIEDVAARGRVSVGTIYNYCQTKGDMLIATVTMGVEEVLATGEAIVSDPPENVAEAVMALVFGYYDHSLKYLSKEMWRHAMALAIEAPKTPNGRHYMELDRRLAAQVVALMESLKTRGRVRPEVEPRAIGR
jgi:AcrR family transcriptional regulator